MKIELEEWEINMVLNGLAELPYAESAATIHRIKEQVDPDIIHCRDCAWFAPLEDYPEAQERHQRIVEIFGDILPRREGKCGVCRKVTFFRKRPVPTREDGYCHRAERREE